MCEGRVVWSGDELEGCSKPNVYVTHEGRVIRRSDELRSSRVRDGSTDQVLSRMFGGGRDKDKKSKAEKKEAPNSRKPESLQGQLELKGAAELMSDEGPAIQESDRVTVLRRIVENEGHWSSLTACRKGCDVEVEQTMQRYLATARGFRRRDKDKWRCWKVESGGQLK